MALIIPKFIHRLVTPRPAGSTPDVRPPSSWLLLHGSEGSEDPLIPHARTLLPDAALLSPRGRVCEEEEGGNSRTPRFYRRWSQTVLDVEDVRFRARELAAFFRVACREYGLPAAETGVLGLEGGATIAAATLLLEPALFRRAVLMRPMLPFDPAAALPDLTGVSVLIAAARQDLRIPIGETEALASLLAGCGAGVNVSWQDCGHGLTAGDLDAVAQWLAATQTPARRGPGRERPDAGPAEKRTKAYN